MRTSKLVIQALIVTLFVMPGANVAVAAAQTQAEKRAATQDRERIFGSQLMTPEERAEHRAKMRSLKTREEREAFRIEHHKKMQERAAKMGKTLPDVPPAQGCGAKCVGEGCADAKCAESGTGGAGY